MSIRMIWPFARLMNDYQAELDALRGAGLTEADLADPDVRLPDWGAMQALRASIEKTGDPAFGIHAAEQIELGDFGVLDYGARCCATFRDAINWWCHYFPLVDDGLRATLVETESTATWSLAPLGIQREPAANDFAVVSSMTLGYRLIRRCIPVTEVHVVHHEATAPAEYDRVFKCPVRTGRAANAIVFPRDHLDLPVVTANPALLVGFDNQAAQLLKEVRDVASVTSRVRDVLIGQLGSGNIGMEAVAKKLHMSIATLRRRLEEEATSHRQVVEDVRRDLALQHLRKRDVAITDVAFLLGFSSTQAFSKAFRRWTGRSAMEYRAGTIDERPD
jgi:AraC-like DNA-binding protein